MKQKKTAKLVVSRKMFASTKPSKKKDSGDKISETPKKKGKKNSNTVSPKKTPKKEKNSSSPRSKTARPDKTPSKSPAKTKTVKATEKKVSNPSYKIGIVSGKPKDINWSELGVQRCPGCTFTTNEANTFAAHTSICRPYNEHKIKTASTSPNKKKQTTKSDDLISFVDASFNHFGRLIGISEKRAVIQEPYLEGSTPAQTVFLFRCYHCRSYFVNIQTLKDHHRLNHGSKNLTLSLVPFTDDEAADDISKKIIVDGNRIVPQVNRRRDNIPVVVSPPLTIESYADSNPGGKITVSNVVSSQSTTSTTITTSPSTLVSPQTHSKLIHSETATAVNNPLQEMCFQVIPSLGTEAKSDEKAVKKGTGDSPKSLGVENLASRLKLVSTPSLASTTNQQTNKMVVLNLIHKYQSVPYSPVQIEIPAGSNLGTSRTYRKQNVNLAKGCAQVIKASPKGSKNVSSSTKIKTILPKSMLMGIHSTPSMMDLPRAPQIQKLGPNLNPGVRVINTTQKLIQITEGQSTITSALSPSKQNKRKIILFPLTSNASTSCSLVTQGTTLTATPIGTAINTSAVVTCATMTSPSMTTPFSSSFAGPNLQTTVSPVLISPTPTNIASSISSVVPSVWVLPSQTSMTSMDSKLTSCPVQALIPKQPQLLKTIHIASTISPTRMTQSSSSTSVSMTAQTVATATASTPLSASKITSSNRPLPNQMVTITPVSEAMPTPVGMSLLEKVTHVKSNTGKPVTTSEKLSDSTPLKQDKAIEVNSKSKIKKSDNSIDTTSSEDKSNSKSIQCILSTNNKRKLDPPPSSITPIPKKKSHICSQTSMTNSPNLESYPSFSMSTPKDVDIADDFTVALLAKKKIPLSTTYTSTIKKPLSKSATPSVPPVVIVRKSLGSNKLVVHTMVSANKLFQIQDSDVLKCSLCADTVGINLIKSHLYWHFHVENRNSAQCSTDPPCHYCKVIDYVVSTIPKNKQSEKNEDISDQINLKPHAEDEKGKSDSTRLQDSCPPVEISSNIVVETEPLVLQISSTVALQTEGNNEQKNKDASDLEPGKKDQQQTEEIPAERLQSSSDLAQNTPPPRDEEPCSIGANDTAKSTDVDIETVIETVNETENPQTVEKKDADDNSPNICNTFFKKESPSQAEKNTVYKGNFYICGFKDCTYSSEGMEKFKIHQENDHCNADGYSCVHCQLECIDPDLLLRHMDTHLCGDMFILYRCAFPECNFGTNLMKSFGEHNLEAHSRKSVFHCYYCSAHFQGCTALQKHLRANLLKYVHCPHCSVRNGLRDTILSHIKCNHPEKPRRIFVTGQMVCEQKQKVLNGSIVINSESDNSDIDSDCMIVDDDILDRHLMKKNTASVRDLFGKGIESRKASKQAKIISDRHDSMSDDDCMIIDKDLHIKQKSLGVLDKNSERVLSPRKTNISANDNIMVQDSDPKLTSNLTEPASLKTNESMVSKQSGNLSETLVLNGTNSSQEKSISKDSTNTDKDSVESEEGSIYLRVKKVTHTYSRQKENQLGLKAEDNKEASNEKFLKDNLDEKDSTTLTMACKRRILIRNSRSRGKVDVGTTGLDSIISPLYLAVDNGVHCRICTFKCVLLMKMHSHILFMHLHVFLYECNLCYKKGSCKVEMTKHCEQHGLSRKGFTVLPEPDWEQVLRSCQPVTWKLGNFKSDEAETTDSQTLPILNATKSTKTENSLSSSKTVRLNKSIDISKPVDSPEISKHSSSANVKISSNDDRNIFSLFSFDPESDTEMPCNKEESQNSSLKNSRFNSSFSSNLFSLPSLPNSDKTPVKDVPDRKWRQRTPTPERHDQITVGKEQYMRELHLIAISKVSNCKQKSKTLSQSTMFRLSKCPNMPLARLRSGRTALDRAPFGVASKSSRAKTSKRSLTRRKGLKNPKILRQKVLSKKSKLKIRSLRRSRSSNGGHLLRSASKGCHGPRTLRSRMEVKKTLLKTPEKYVAQKRPQSLKSPSSSLRTKSTPQRTKSTPQRTKSTPPASSKPPASRLAVNLKRDKHNSTKLKASVRVVAKKKNFAISRQRSLKKALNQASRKKSAWTKRQLISRKSKISKGQPLKISSPRKTDTKKCLSMETVKKNCLFFSCSWCQFRVTDRKHFQRHISLHNFFPQGCKMHCPYCSYTTPDALVLEKHIPMHEDKHPYGCRHCGFSAKTKMMVVRHCKRSHPEIPLKLVNRSTSTQKLKPSWPVVSFSPKVRLKKCSITAGRYTCPNFDKPRFKRSETKNR